ncbi:TIGR00730 family Rossman fold protein [Amorphus orientalis]|uniref:Cytokinin riboside 5'-monophosphate phosphoribohydrolase n=1 Tax=Amorphus orientalis TaxID=649198 RepID=A0AAE3VR45_9HYPH|nr:TIGR00730 family Rossman fold protein [Amorphus orientalis]MDQ0316443.1 uncharacterized protein (TIGR00730 family) [Amorphus orientalis]
MSNMKRICVYCGSGHGIDPSYEAAARDLGRALASEGIELVYGGGSVGLMGTLAHSVLSSGGRVTGVIPQFLKDREVMLNEVTELITTGDMHERKRIMFERADAFVALPGGIGTLEEAVEMMTWSQLGQHRKPILMANINRFWDPLVHLLDHMRKEAFIRPGLDVAFMVCDEIGEVVPRLRAEVARRSEPEGDDATIEKL